MTNEEAIELLQGILEGMKGGENIPELKLTMEALNMAIKALDQIKTLDQIKNIVDSAEMIIEEQYGVVIVEGYYDVFELIKKKVRLLEE